MITTVKVETNRFILRELEIADASDLFELDRDEEVHRFLEPPVQHLEQIYPIIEGLQNQYRQNGIARWAVVDKGNGECVGWCGLKFMREPVNDHIHFYDLGYRFKRKHWGRGMASETARAVLQYGFDVMDLAKVYATTHLDNTGSIHVLEKLGFEQRESFMQEGKMTRWFELEKGKWLTQ